MLIFLKNHKFCFFFFVAIAAISCIYHVFFINTSTRATNSENNISAFSTFKSLSGGNYDGAFKLEEVTNKGDFGFGYFGKLDGQMVLSEGKIYQIKEDGSITSPDKNSEVAFALVTNFKKSNSFQIKEALTMPKLRKFLAENANKNLLVAIKIDGNFKKIKLINVSKQIEPYQKLKEVLKEQKPSEYQDIAGTIIGFRSLGVISDVAGSGLNLYFINKDKNKGGKVTSFVAEELNLEIQNISELKLFLPVNAKESQDVEKEPTTEENIEE